MPERRIPADELAVVSQALFNKARFSGAELARNTGANTNTLWTHFFRRGVTPKTAREIAENLDAWASELLSHSRTLRQLATKAEHGAFDELPVGENVE